MEIGSNRQGVEAEQTYFHIYNINKDYVFNSAYLNFKLINHFNLRVRCRIDNDKPGLRLLNFNGILIIRCLFIFVYTFLLKHIFNKKISIP